MKKYMPYLLAFCLLLAIVGGLSLGLPGVGRTALWQMLTTHGLALPPALADAQTIILELRLPRVLLAVVAGAGLALAGVGTQSVLQNPLVCPSVLGLASGAAFGASVAIMFGPALYLALGWPQGSGHPQTLMIILAFAMAMVAVLLAYGLAALRRSSRETILLAGIAVNYMFGAGIIMLQYLADWQDLRAIVFWTVGSLWNANTTAVWVISTVLLPTTLAFYALSPRLDALSLGEESAQSLGVHVKTLRLGTLCLAALTSATIISFTGAIGFVGLMAPHMARSIMGTGTRALLPTAMLIGALLLLVADTASRMVLWPQELPVGIMTSLCGGPFFLFLLLRRKKDWWQ